MSSKMMTSDVLKRPYRTILSPDPSGGFVATIHEFPGCVGHGSDANEAIADLNARAESWVDAALETGFPIPEPEDYDDYSGKVALRMSRRVHKMAAERAAREKVSLNQLLVTAISTYLGQVDGIGSSKQAFQQTVNEFLSSLSSKVVGNMYITAINAPQTNNFLLSGPEHLSGARSYKFVDFLKPLHVEHEALLKSLNQAAKGIELRPISSPSPYPVHGATGVG